MEKITANSAAEHYVLPENKIWRADSDAVQSAMADYDGEKAAEADGATVGIYFSVNNRDAQYTHTNGEVYSFTKALHGGGGEVGKYSVSIVPKKASCTVTVVFDGNGDEGRNQYIDFNGQIVGKAQSGTGVSVVTADITKAMITENPGAAICTYGGGCNKNLYAVFIEYYPENPVKKLSGTVTNKTGRDFAGKNIVFTNVDDLSERYAVPYGDIYSLDMPKGKTFTAAIEGEADVCTTLASKTIPVSIDRYGQTADLTFVLIREMEVRGTVSTISSHDLRTPVYGYDNSIGASLTFTSLKNPAYKITAAVSSGGTYSVAIMSGETYSITLMTAGGYNYTLSPKSSQYVFEAGDENPFRNILLMKDGPASIAYKDTLSVGADKEYNTISEAIAAVRLMKREKGQAVNIMIDGGTYQEQIYVDADDIALKAADPSNRPLIQWYYGIGYVYYSINDGWFNADNAVAKTEKNTAVNWGAVIKTLNRGFYMENIDVRSTFNLFITEQELDDGITSGGSDAKPFVRDSIDTAVNNYSANERAAAIFAGGSEIEIYNCSFTSSQDTFGTGADSMYVKDCMISGNTDYICGGNNCYFENCELRWRGMTDRDNGGYITACKVSGNSDLGYYFKNCVVTKNSDKSMLSGKGGYWGRPWGGKGTPTIFDGTAIANGINKPEGWTSMGGIDPKDARFYVIGGIHKSDTDLTAEIDNPSNVKLGTVPDAKDFFGDWTPKNYSGK